MFILLIISALLVLLFVGYVFNWLYRASIIDDDQFVGRRVFITGTDSGFGRELTLKLDRLGVIVYAGCFTEDGERSLRDTASGQLRTLRLDVTDDDSVLAAKQFVENDLRVDGITDGLWGLVNNAGIARGQIFAYASMTDYRTVMEVNFFGVVRVTEAFIPLIIKSSASNDCGRIINIISILSRCSGISEPYACSKFALQPYTDGLRRYMASFGVQVASIEPGFFKTKLCDQETLIIDLNRSWMELTPEMRHIYEEDFHQSVKDTVSRLTKSPPLANFNRVSMVVDSIVHALRARHPKSRYVIGLDACFIYIPVGLMPNWFTDCCSRLMLPFQGLLTNKLRMRKKSKND